MEFIYEKSRIYAEDEKGKLVAELVFPDIADGVVNIEHTFVDESLRGQGIANDLYLALVEKLKQENKKATLTCGYSVKWFKENDLYSELLKKD